MCLCKVDMYNYDGRIYSQSKLLNCGNNDILRQSVALHKQLVQRRPALVWRFQKENETCRYPSLCASTNADGGTVGGRSSRRIRTEINITPGRREYMWNLVVADPLKRKLSGKLHIIILRRLDERAHQVKTRVVAYRCDVMIFDYTTVPSLRGSLIKGRLKRIPVKWKVRRGKSFEINFTFVGLVFLIDVIIAIFRFRFHVASPHPIHHYKLSGFKSIACDYRLGYTNKTIVYNWAGVDVGLRQTILKIEN